MDNTRMKEKKSSNEKKNLNDQETPVNAPTYVIHGQTTAIVFSGSGCGGGGNDGNVVYKSNNEWLQFHNSLMQINPRQYKSAHDFNRYGALLLSKLQLHICIYIYIRTQTFFVIT